MSKNEQSKLTVTPDRSKILMSDSLKDVFREEDPFAEAESIEDKFVIIALDHIVGGKRIEPILGTLVSFLLDASPEVEVKVSIPIAFSIFKSMGQLNHVNELQLHHGDDQFSLEGPYVIEAIRVQDINAAAQTCVLAMKLSKQDT